ncbi:hypothetical protein [Vibrio natriegens]|uniref:hypothetical protein n=1 Tax=Vibrio natriegens TaxID=691 RepID=UPI003B5AE66E
MAIEDSILNNNEEIGILKFSDTYLKYRIVSTSKPLVIAFPPLGHSNELESINIDSNPWAFEFLCRYDVNIISFGYIGEHNYFKSDDFVNFLEMLSPLLDVFPCRLGYGFSRGGFGVGAYANLLKLDKILLVHPISTKNKELVPWDTRWTTREASVINWNTKYSDVSLPKKCRVWIFYDPLNEIDTLHAKRFVSDYVKYIKIWGLGHATGLNFLIPNSNLWHHLIRNFIFDDDLNNRTVLKFKRYLRVSPKYYELMLNRVNSKLRREVLVKANKKVRKIADINVGNAHDGVVSDKLSPKVVDIIRDLALTYESSNLDVAYELMKLAHHHRPTGPFILKKMNEYKNKLHE